ncbi:lysylphosphatidylglycerol synthase domain-containing protein [Umezawaea sp. Da 62-37]|uniref:lysylphosphatidylglycerol synthase domain-containing protein n=1 Tax=Umezawaea sp. Da 62-37 TaxID=3075927 RepID=UPI0028F742AF|nr:lysylphosphatidylglycerol synthase domain-containing protein [Umezawaea sp. Da 62-37]WNV87206.1 lysylphosphatidylglycerol synthase domain-containing protein [Umezawaea sp. Da 62-37]
MTAQAGKKHLPRWLRIAATTTILVIAAVYIGHDLVGRGEETLQALRALRPAPLVLALLVVSAGVVITALSWREPLSAMSGPITSGDAIRLFAAGQLGKYVPGVMWSVVLQAQLAARSGITSTQIVATFGVYALISIATGAGIGLPATAALADDRPVWVTGGMIGLAVVGLLVLPWVLRLVLHRASRLRLLRDRLAPVGIKPLRRSMLLCTVSWLVSGLHVWVLAIALGASPSAALLPCVAGFALATVAGTLVFVVPDGLGVREGVLVAVLSGCLPLPAAVVVATASRVLLICSDVVMFLYGSWSARRARVDPAPIPR